MSFMTPGARPQRDALTEKPAGQVVSTYSTHAEARHAIDVLAEENFPVRSISLIGNGLSSVERVTGRVGWGRVAFSGASGGAYLGIFIGFIQVLLMPKLAADIAVTFGSAIIICMGLGMLFAIIMHGRNPQRKTFTSVTQVIASRYDLIVPDELLSQARSILTAHATAHAAGHSNGHTAGHDAGQAASGNGSEKSAAGHSAEQSAHGHGAEQQENGAAQQEAEQRREG